MAKDIEKLIEEFVIPEMEYSPSYEKKGKGKGKDAVKTVTIDEIPEVVLPKTKAEMYEEAKGRLNQKTSAVSRRVKKTDGQAETAATVTLNPASKTITRTITKTVTRSDLQIEKTSKKKPVAADVRLSPEPAWVGGEEEIVPFAWRQPLLPDLARPCKYYKQVVREAKELLLPVPRTTGK